MTSPLPVSSAYFRYDQWGINLGAMPVPDKADLFQLQYTNPAYFSQTVANNAANLETILSSPHSNQETIRAGYVMENSRVGKWIIQAGGRYESTDTISSVPVIEPVSKNLFATKTVNASTGATTYVDESIIANLLTSALNRGDAQILKERIVCDVGLGWKLSGHMDLFLSGRNAFNAGKNWYFKSDHRMQQKEKYGGQWTIGMKGSY